MLFFRFNILISRLSLLEAVSALIIFLCAYNVLFSARAISHAFLCETYLPFYSPVARGYGTLSVRAPWRNLTGLEQSFRGPRLHQTLSLTPSFVYSNT